ncbi:MAG: TonB-dependent receptor [Chitinophagaceae bacterium]|nr:MAG: TonB-dependent receptor [Chitinophagaceae bacterium]
MRKLPFLGLALLLLASQLLFAQTKTISGKVTDSKDGSPLQGVSVQVKGSTTGTVTATDGSFSIVAPASASTLVISSLGFDSKEVAVTGASLSISLVNSESRSLDEIVVVGYGTNSKRNLAGNIAQVKGADIRNLPVPDLTAALQGRAAGVFVEAGNGKVGEGIKMRIRGSSSIAGSNEPLYVVDGVPVVGGLSGSATADINFNDVESFEILKDASAAAIYGSRASNGVVLITTRRGKAGKTSFNVSSQYGWNKPTNDDRGFLNAKEYIDYFTMAAENAAKYHYNRADNWRGYASEQAAINDMLTYVRGRFNRYSGGTDWANGAVNTNWEKLAFQDADNGQIDVSASGGNDKTKFFLSGNTSKQDGILIGNKFKKSGARLNLDNEATSWLKLGFNLSITKVDRDRVPADNQFTTPMQIVALSPITPVRDPEGNLYNTPTTTYYNPLLDYEGATWKLQSWRNQGKVFADVSLLKGLTFRSELGLDVINQDEERYWGPNTLTGNVSPTVKGVASNSFYRNTRTLIGNYLSYGTTIAGMHKIDANVGMSYENIRSRYATVGGQGFPDETLRTLASASEITSGSASIDEDALVSYFGRATYVFDKKIIVNASARVDGSARFGKDHKYGFFPAASLGWILSDYDFLKSSSFISFLKPRVSYGVTGNNAIGLYAANRTYAPSSYALVPALALASPGNDDLKWETTEQLDAGLEFGFFKGRLTGEFDYYVKKTKDLLYSQPTTSISGVTTVVSNIGSMENKGVEFVLNSTNIATRDFTWTSSFNIARNKNKVTKLDGEQTVIRGDARFANSIVVGQPIGIFYGVKYAGVDVQNGDPLFYEADGKTTTNDYSLAGTDFIIGDPNPDWIGGLTNTVAYKGLELSFMFQGVFGNQVQDGAGGFMSASADWFDNQTRDQLNSWKKPGDITNVPEARLNRFGDFASPSISSRYISDAGYVRLKTVSLGYTLPKSVTTRLRINSARFFVTGVNLLTITDYKGWDPEVNTDYRSGNVNQGSDFYAAPQIKSIVFGLTLGL